MRKTDKKIDAQLRTSLTNVCDLALLNVAGFQWLTHKVNFNDFPNSLKVICVFDTNDSLSQAKAGLYDKYLVDSITTELHKLGIKLKRQSNQILFDTEENCLLENEGKWKERLL